MTYHNHEWGLSAAVTYVTTFVVPIAQSLFAQIAIALAAVVLVLVVVVPFKRRPSPSSRHHYYVQPIGCASRMGHNRENMSMMDEFTANKNITYTYRFDGILDEDLLRRGLKEVLTVYPVLAARVDYFSNQDSWQFVYNTNGNCGVLFEVESHKENKFDRPLPDEMSHFKEWAPWAMPCVLRFPKPEEPLTKVRLTTFQKEQVSFLSIYMNHMIGDAKTFTLFLRAWGRASLGKEIGVPRQTNTRVTQPKRPFESKQEMINWWKHRFPGGRPPPIDRYAWLKQLPKTILSAASSTTLEYRVLSDKLQELKTKLTRKLPPGAWVSSYEVMMGALVWYGHKNRGCSSHTLACVVDYRDRVKHFHREYFGNPVDVTPTRATIPLQGELHEAILAFHHWLRGYLSTSEEELRAPLDWKESGRSMGLRVNMTDAGLPDDFPQRMTISNSWCKFPYFHSFPCKDGKSRVATVVHIPLPRMVPGYLLELPRTPNGVNTILLGVPNNNLTMYDSVPFLDKIVEPQAP